MSEHVMYFSICYVYISLWPLMSNFPFCCVEEILSLFFFPYSYTAIWSRTCGFSCSQLLRDTALGVWLLSQPCALQLTFPVGRNSTATEVRSPWHFNSISPRFQSWLVRCHGTPIKGNASCHITHSKLSSQSRPGLPWQITNVFSSVEPWDR